MDQHAMQCMEVWGGNQVADSGVVMAGLDAWVYSRPFGGADGGGDVYYVSSCATGRITRLLIADVSGHGAAVGPFASSLRALMRKHINQIDQSRFVRSMNQQFGELARAECFATALVTTFFSPTNQLSLCNAGHPPPLLYRAATGRWSYLEHKPTPRPGGAADNVPLGVVDEAHYDQFDVQLKVGDLVLCYTDSLTEARDRDGQMLGQDGLLRIVRGIDVSEPIQLTVKLLAAVEECCDTEKLSRDDVTVLLFRPNGLAPNTPVRQRLLAPLRVLRSVLRSLRPGGESAAWPELSVPAIGGAIIGRLNRVKGRSRRVKLDA